MGEGFVVTRLVAGYHTIFLLNGSRFQIGGLLLLPLTKLNNQYQNYAVFSTTSDSYQKINKNFGNNFIWVTN